MSLKYELKNVQERLDIIYNMQEKILDKLNNHCITTDDTPYTENIIYSMQSDEDLEKMEDKLLNDIVFKKTVVIKICYNQNNYS